jgi:hypothetical protein
MKLYFHPLDDIRNPYSNTDKNHHFLIMIRIPTDANTSETYKPED